MKKLKGTAGCVILVFWALGSSACEEQDDRSNPYSGHQSDVYQDTAHWLCHPDLVAPENVCDRNLAATIIQSDGATQIEPHQAAVSPDIDCFYVYPTISFDLGGNSDLMPNDEEIFITLTQAGRYSAVCRVFAPVYRQTTIPALLWDDGNPDRELAYQDVLDAFKTYMAHHNQDRGYVLISHSQGTVHLRRLIQEEIEGSPYLAERLVAAHLIGMTIAVPVGQDVGGTFQSTPLCRTPDQTGCVITYASFRATEPPDESSLFGATDDPDTVAACTNPANLAGGQAELDGYSPTELTDTLTPFISNPGPWAEPAEHPPVETVFFKLPGMASAQCVERDGYHYLEVEVTADASDPRADDIGGDFAQGWGLHLADINLALGDLVRLARSQADAWLSAR